MKRRIWTLPALRVKTDAPFRIHLSDEALEVVKAAKAHTQAGNPFLFPGRAEGKAQGKGVLSKAMLRIADRLEEQGCRRFKPHELRKTFRTMLSRLGVAPHIAELCINHKEEETMRRVYDGHDYFAEMIAAWSKAGAHLTALRQGGADVIPISKSRESA
jgi:integrase